MASVIPRSGNAHSRGAGAGLSTRARRLTAAAVATVLGVGALSAAVGVVTSPVPAAAGSNVTPTIFVADYGGSTITSYPLTARGNAAPAATNSSTRLGSPAGEAFDAAGDLWVANRTGGVVEYTRSQLATSGSPTPAVTISGPAVTSACGLAFDPDGDLWVGSCSNGDIMEYTPP